MSWVECAAGQLEGLMTVQTRTLRSEEEHARERQYARVLRRFFMYVHAYRPGLIALTLVLTSTLVMYGQGANGSFTGTVKDSTGGLIPNATVTATNADTGTSWHTQTNSSGFYIFPTVPPGNYSLAVEAAGFKRATTNRVSLEVDQVLRRDYTLEVGAVSETIEVSGTAAALQTETTQLGSLITGNTTANLPLNGRNFAQLTLLAPGVVNYNVTGFTEGSRGGGQPLVTGNPA